MFKTFISKFTFFFWLVFFVINIPIYLFGTQYIKSILKDSEQEQIALMVNTLKPILALNISFNQEEQLNTLLTTMLQNDNIKTIELVFTNKQQKIELRNSNDFETLFIHSNDIIDPFDKRTIATMTLTYSSKYFNSVQNKINTTLLFTFLFTLFIFVIFYIFVRNNLNALHTISTALQKYSITKQINPIVLHNKCTEMNTIANVANEMLENIAKYVHKLKSFNSELKKQVQIEIKKQQKQENLLIHQSRQAAMGEMLESIAHQWRQPLNIIGISVTNLETLYLLGKIDDKDLTDKLSIISLNVNYMSNTIDDFRNFLSPNREVVAFNPQKSIQETLKIVDAQLNNNNIFYTLNCDDSLMFTGVESEFIQVLFILINNAKDAIKSSNNVNSSKHGELIININRKNDKGIIEVIDNGTGIQEDIMETIFEPYFTTKFTASGTGIGLYIAKNIIENRMEGLLVAKNLDNGSSFTITLALSNCTKDEFENSRT